MNQCLINFTPTGMIPTKLSNPFTPITPEEIIDEVQRAYEIGITIVHLHARDEAGLPTSEIKYYQKIVDGVRKYCPDLVVCVSLSGRNISDVEKRAEPLLTMPDMASLTLSSLNFPKTASVNAPDTIMELARKIRACGAHPELEVFDLGMINASKYLIKKGLIDATSYHYFNIILGNLFGMQTDFATMGAAISSLPPNSFWAFGGIGEYQLKANAAAIFFDGGIRIGLEDNLYFDKNRKVLADNIPLLKRVHTLLEIAERTYMKPKTFGELGFYNDHLLKTVLFKAGVPSYGRCYYSKEVLEKIVERTHLPVPILRKGVKIGDIKSWYAQDGKLIALGMGHVGKGCDYELKCKKQGILDEDEFLHVEEISDLEGVLIC